MMVVTKPIADFRKPCDGNLMNLLGIASRALHMADPSPQGRKTSEEMRKRAFAASSYDEGIQIIMEYVDVKR